MLNTLFKTKKDAVKSLERTLNPKGRFDLKVVAGEESSISYLKCQSGMNGEECPWAVRIKAKQKSVKGKRQPRQFHTSMQCSEHKNCGAIALMEATPARKKQCSLVTLPVRADWSTPDNKVKMTEAIQQVQTKVMSQAQAALTYGIPPSVLSKTISGQRGLDTKRGRATYRYT